MHTNQAGSITRQTTVRSSSSEQRNEMIAVAAYFRAEQRGFGNGDPVADWLEAESEIDRMLRLGPGSSTKQKFLDRIEAQIQEWDLRIDELQAKAKGLKTKARSEYLKELETLAGLRAALREKLLEVGKHSGDAWEDLRHGAEQAWTEMREALEHVGGRFK